MNFNKLPIIILFIIIYFIPLKSHSEKLPPGKWEKLHSQKYTIYYEPQDQSAAEQLQELYNNKLTEIASQLLLEMPDNFFVFIAPNQARFRYLTRGLPEWTGGAVYSRQRTVILLSPRVIPNPEQYSITALHEGVHLLTELDGKANLPRWLSEGLAMYFSGETMFRNQVPLARAVILNKTYTLDEIDDVLKLGPEQARVAYLQSINAVRFLIEKTGYEGMSKLITGLKNGETIEALFHKINGFSFLDFEIAWHSDLRKQYRWWKLVEWFDFDMTLWGSASVLVLVVGSITIYRRKKYLRDKDMDDMTHFEVDNSYYAEPFPGEIYVDEDHNWNK